MDIINIDDAINHCEEVAENRCDECGREHTQLAIWLRELKSLRKILEDNC